MNRMNIICILIALLCGTYGANAQLINRGRFIRPNQQNGGAPQGRPGEGRMCAIQCQQANNCPSPQATGVLLRSSGPACIRCLVQQCGTFNRNNMASVLPCISANRGNCSACPVRSANAVMIQQRCSTCIRQCVQNQTVRSTSVGRIFPGRIIATKLACARGCSSGDSCPTRENIRNFLNGTQQACRECIINECGPFSRNNRSDALACVMQARADCSECPTLTPHVQLRMRRCKICVAQCSLNRVTGGRLIRNRTSPLVLQRLQPLRTFRCVLNCQTTDRCPFQNRSNGLLQTLQSFNSECRECLIEECGTFDRSNRNEMMECISEARDDCSECPQRTSEQQLMIRNCSTCLRGCFPFGEGRGTTARPRHIAFRPIRVLSCLINCRNNSTCPSRDGVMRRASSECRSCVMQQCGPFRRSNASNPDNIDDCIEDAADECTSCPTLTDEEQVERRQCRTCIKGCIRRKTDMTTARRTSVGRIFPGRIVATKLACARGCSSGDSCPTRENIRNFLNGTQQACRECIINECGPFSRNNRSDALACVMQARADCSECPTLTRHVQLRMRRCKICVAQCSLNRVTGGRLIRNRTSPLILQRFQPLRTFGCVLNCQTTDRCPSQNLATRLSQTLQSFNSECRECLIEECGSFDRSNRDEMMECISQARDDCSECPQRTPMQQMMIRNCSTCLRGCFPFGAGRGTTGRPHHIPFRPIRVLSCLRNCRNNSTCPSRDGVMRRASSECRSCVMQQCGPLRRTNASNRDNIDDCIEDAADECTSCPTLTDEEQVERRQCRTCIKGCIQRKPGFRLARTIGSRLRREPFQRISCLNNCRAADACPNMEEIRNSVMSNGRECRACIRESCGSFDRSNRSNLLDCATDARRDCEECPTLTAEEQSRGRRCKSCVRNCLPQIGNGFRPPFPIQPLQRISCVRNCQSQDECPSREDFLAKFQMLTQECRECVMEGCGSLNRRNMSAFVDCIEETREECSDCPDVTDSERQQMGTCRSCVSTCISEQRTCINRTFPVLGRGFRGGIGRRPSNGTGRNHQGQPLSGRHGQNRGQASPPRMCRSSCQASGMCPNISGIISTATQNRIPSIIVASCVRCLRLQNCMRVFGGRDAVETRCHLAVRISCTTCPSLSSMLQNRAVTCAMCVRNCSDSDDDDTDAGNSRQSNDDDE